MIITRITVRYSDRPQIALSVNFKSENLFLIKSVVKEYYGANHVLLTFMEE